MLLDVRPGWDARTAPGAAGSVLRSPKFHEQVIVGALR